MDTHVPTSMVGGVQKFFIGETCVIQSGVNHWFRICNSFFVKLSLRRDTNR